MGAADNFFKKADQVLKKKGGLDYAIEMFQQGLAIDPDRLEERKKLRGVSIRRCMDSGANTLGGARVKIKNTLLIGSIKKLGLRKQFEEQIVALEKFLAEAPQNIDANMSLARAFEHTARWPSALWAYTTVAEVDQQNADAYKSLGRIYAEHENDVERAIQCWERVREARPEDQEAGKAIRDLSAAAMIQRADARRGEGDGSFRDLLKDEDESSKLEKKQALIRTSDDAVSVIELKKEDIQNNPTNSRLWRELGDLYLQHMKDFDEAGNCYEKAREIDPHDLFVTEKLQTLREKQIEDKVLALETQAQASPDDAALQQQLAELYKERDVFMLEEYKRRVEAHPTDYGLKYKYGALLKEAERHDEAIGQFQQSRKDPKYAMRSNHSIGQSFFAKGLFDLAIKEFNSALSAVADPDSEDSKGIRYNLAIAYEAKGDMQKALEYFEEIMSLDIVYRDASQKVDEIRKRTKEAG